MGNARAVEIALDASGWSQWIEALGGSFPNLPDGTLIHRDMYVCVGEFEKEQIERGGRYRVVPEPMCATCPHPRGIVGELSRKDEEPIWTMTRKDVLLRAARGEDIYNTVHRYRYYRYPAVLELQDLAEGAGRRTEARIEAHRRRLKGGT